MSSRNSMSNLDPNFFSPPRPEDTKGDKAKRNQERQIANSTLGAGLMLCREGADSVSFGVLLPLWWPCFFGSRETLRRRGEDQVLTRWIQAMPVQTKTAPRSCAAVRCSP